MHTHLNLRLIFSTLVGKLLTAEQIYRKSTKVSLLKKVCALTKQQILSTQKFLNRINYNIATGVCILSAQIFLTQTFKNKHFTQTLTNLR